MGANRRPPPQAADQQEPIGARRSSQRAVGSQSQPSPCAADQWERRTWTWRCPRRRQRASTSAQTLNSRPGRQNPARRDRCQTRSCPTQIAQHRLDIASTSPRHHLDIASTLPQHRLGIASISTQHHSTSCSRRRNLEDVPIPPPVG
eukprot:1194777-Prorocentrum_minimum.AAC.6